jgi:SAM-dependent methyltransferase
VLEIGAGPGYVSSLLQKKGCIVEAVEADPYRAGFLRNQMKVTVHEGRFEDAPLKDQSYDMVVMSQVLMHLYSIKETMQKIARILKPGGLLVSSQMNFNSIAQQTVRAPYPGRGLTAFTISSWFTPESMQNILRLSGFEVKKIMFRPSGLFGYVFPEGYPGGVFTNVVLKAINQLLKIILIRTRTSDYFTVVAIKRD